MNSGGLTRMTSAVYTLLSVAHLLATPTCAARNDDNQKEGEESENYALVIDAGSSSSKLKIYRWSPPKTCLMPPRVTLVTNERFKPSIASLKREPLVIGEYLGKILSLAKTEVPAAKKADTPLYLMTTAGLRFFSAQDAYHMMDIIRTVLENTTLNPFSYSRANVEILSGEKEGVYAWIAANYLLGFFDTPMPANESVGVLEMGGGSTQIAFIPQGPLFSEEFQVRLAGQIFKLYVQSYLHFGSNSIRVQIAHQLALQHPGQSEVKNPCMLKDDVSKTRLEDNTELTQRGIGKPDACLDILQNILRPTTGLGCQPKPCAIGSVYQPELANISFYATHAFTYAPRNLKAMGKNGFVQLDRLQSKAQTHCKRTMKQAEEMGLSTEYASHDCLMGLYIPTLLSLSYGFSPDSSSIKFTSKVGSEGIDWALGAAIVELSARMSQHRTWITCTTYKSIGSSVNSVKGDHGALSNSRWNSLVLLLVLCALALKHDDILQAVLD